MLAHSFRSFRSFRLGEVDQEDPEIPPFDLRAGLDVGDLAALLLETPEETYAKWASIERVIEPGVYLGILENGEEVKFSAENIFDLEERPHQSQIESQSYSLGAWYDIFKPEKEKPKPKPSPEARPSSPFRSLGPEERTPERIPELWEILVPEAERKDPHFQYSKVFDIFGPGTRPAPRQVPAREPTPPTPPPYGATPEGKKGWFDFLRRKPKGTSEVIGPIPPAERREQHSFRRLPGPPPPPGAAPAEEEPRMAPEQQAIIVPEVEAGLTPIPGEAIRYDDLFDVLGPAPGAQAPQEPQAPQAPQASLPAAIAAETALPMQMDAFSILEVAPQQQAAFGPPGRAIDPFEMIRQQEATPFDILSPQSPAEPREMVIRTEGGLPTQMDVFNVLEPIAPLATVYGPPAQEGPSLFDALTPKAAPPPPQSPEAAVERAAATQKAKRKKSGAWALPSREEWVRWIKESFDLDNLWKYIRSERNSEYFLEQQLGDEEGGTAPVETWADLDWETAFEYFGVPPSVYDPYLKRIAKEEEEVGYADEAWQDFQENLVYPLGNAIYEAFKTITPADIPGGFVLGDDGDNGTWGLLYFERLDPKKASRRQKEVQAEKERNEREAKEISQHRKSELKRIWGRMPGPEDLVGWIEEKFDLDEMFADIQKAVKTKGWKSEIREYGQAELSLEVIADLGPKRAKEYEYDIASYFGIPPDIIALYQEAGSSQDLWNEIFWPFFENLQEAFVMLLPYAGLPGIIVVDEDEEDRLVLEYREENEG